MTPHYDTAQIIECLPLGVIVTDRKGTIQIVNRYAKSLLAEDLHHIDSLLGGEGLALETLLQARAANTRTWRVNRSGMTFELIGAVIAGKDDAVIGTVFTLRDISEIEKRRALEKRKERYAVIGELSAEIAHEIRNPLGSIELFASLLKKELTRGKDVSRINQIIAAVKSVEHKITELILTGQSSQVPSTAVNVHDILKDIMLFSERIIDHESVYLSIQYADVQPIIECNADLIKQVFLNLIIKALQTIPEPGRLDILTRYQPESQSIEIHFIDNSPRPGQDAAARIFDSSVRPREKNTGLDLAIVHNIVNMYQGSIRIELVEGTGTAFIISFPLLGLGMPESVQEKKTMSEKAKGE